FLPVVFSLQQSEITIHPLDVARSARAAGAPVGDTQRIQLTSGISGQAVLRSDLVLVIEAVFVGVARQLGRQQFGGLRVSGVAVVEGNQGAELAIVARILGCGRSRLFRTPCKRRVLLAGLDLLLHLGP